ncbi:hypothetical protein AURDEDRAFT_163276 [Auricularia subglabra TFB-10046 SS5]|nr:hypothetical protein AURDEDRAFT_163276 [Auricularia subglabra TFB-10046 SS5]
MSSVPNHVLRTVLKGKYVYIDRCVFCRAGEEERLLQLREKILALGAKITFTLSIADIVLVAGLRTLLDEALKAAPGIIVYSWYIDDVYDAGAIPTSPRYFVDLNATFPFDVAPHLPKPHRPAPPVQHPETHASRSRTPSTSSAAGSDQTPNIRDPKTPQPHARVPPPIVASRPLRPYEPSNLHDPTTPEPPPTRDPTTAEAPLRFPNLSPPPNGPSRPSTFTYPTPRLTRTHHPPTPPDTSRPRYPLPCLRENHAKARCPSPATLADELEVAKSLTRKRKAPPARRDRHELSDSSEDERADDEHSLYVPSDANIYETTPPPTLPRETSAPDRRSISLGPPRSDDEQPAPQAPANHRSIPEFPIPTFQFPANRSDFQHPEVRQYAAEAVGWMTTYTELGDSQAGTILTKCSRYLWEIAPEEITKSTMYNCVKRLHTFRNDLLVVIRAARKKAQEQSVAPYTLDQLDTILQDANERYVNCRSRLTPLKQAGVHPTHVQPPVPVHKSSQRTTRQSVHRAVQPDAEQASPRRSPRNSESASKPKKARK